MMFPALTTSTPRVALGDKDLNQLENSIRDQEQVSAATQTARDENAVPNNTHQPTKNTKPLKVNRNKASKLLDVSDIHLEGENTHSVPIYDTCDEVRRKIRAFLRKDGVTQAALLRAIGRCRVSNDQQDAAGPISSSSYRSFMRQQGPTAGGNSDVHYAGYVFFEKVRLRDGKPKSKKREEMESAWGGSSRTGKKGGGMSTGGRYVLCRRDEVPMVDKYGRMQIVSRRPVKF